MSEGGDLAGAPRAVIRNPHNQQAALLLIALALVGPVLGLMFGKHPGLIEGLRAGWFSLPMAAFGAALLVLGTRNPQDFYGGTMLVALGLFSLWAGSDLPGMRGFAFGPGTAPRLFAYALIGVGVAVALVGLLTVGPPEEKYAFRGPLGGALLIIVLIPITIYAARIGKLVPGVPPDVIVAAVGAVVVFALALALVRFVPRGPLFITAATLIFAISVRPLGLVISSYVMLMVAAAATEEVRWIEMVIWGAVLTLFCSLLFPYGLNLPLQLWPRF